MARGNHVDTIANRTYTPKSWSRFNKKTLVWVMFLLLLRWGVQYVCIAPEAKDALTQCSKNKGIFSLNKQK